MYKKGAMFGLDARIALAIFGALSVISGAALFSAIQDSKVTALLTDMTELAKAYEQYYLDTGQHTPKINAIDMNAAYLVDDTLAVPYGWKGPYIGYESSDHTPYFSNKVAMLRNGDKIFFTQAKGSVWSAPVSLVAGQCSTAQDCYVYVRLDNQDSSIIKLVDMKVDGSINHLDGNIRYNGTTGQVSAYYKVMLKTDI
tara:strand:- start:1062 stop:1655 length:594 start_codon:yes stop_codon:yes gene_type:complete